MGAVDALNHQKQLLFVPMDKNAAAGIKAAFYNKLLMPNPIFEEHEKLIESSQAAWRKAQERKKLDASEKRNTNSSKT